MYFTEQQFYLNCILLIISYLRRNLKRKHELSPPLEGVGERKNSRKSSLQPPPKQGVIGSEFRTNFILFDSPKG